MRPAAPARLSRMTALAALAVLATGCKQVPIPAVLSPGVDRPENRRYMEYLTAGGGLADLGAGQTAPGPIKRDRAVSFIGARSYEPYAAPVLVGDPLQRELDRLLTCIAAGWPGAKPDRLRLSIGSSAAPSAQALPDEISVNVGLLGIADEDMPREQRNRLRETRPAEIAFILAHEYAHVLLDHYGRAEFVAAQKRALQGATELAVLAAYAAEVRGRRTGDRMEFFLEDEHAAGRHALTAVGIYAASQILAEGVIESSWSRTQEYEADLLALDLLEAAGIDSSGALNALDGMQRHLEASKTRMQTMDRQARAIMDEAAKTADPSMIIAAGAQVMMTATMNFVLDLYDRIDVSHPSPMTRKEEVQNYGMEIEMLDAPAPAARGCRLDRLKNQLAKGKADKVARAIRQAAEAEEKLLEGDVDGARALAAAALRGPGLASHPVPNIAAFHVESRAGRPARALRHLENITRRANADTPFSVYTLIAGEYLVRRRWREMERVISAGEQHFPKEMFYPQRLQLVAARGDDEGYERMRERCADAEDDDIRAACRQIHANRAKKDGGGGLFASAQAGAGKGVGATGAGSGQAATGSGAAEGLLAPMAELSGRFGRLFGTEAR